MIMNILLWNNHEKISLTARGHKLVLSVSLYNCAWTIVVGLLAIIASLVGWFSPPTSIVLSIVVGWMSGWSFVVFVHSSMFLIRKLHAKSSVSTSWTIFFVLLMLVSLNPVNVIIGLYTWTHYNAWVHPHIVKHGGLHEQPPDLYYY